MAASEMVYALIGLALVAWIYWINRGLLRGGVSAIEIVCYLVALPALVIGWYFNIVYLREYGADAGWWHWTTLLFVNPASASGGQDLIFANLILFPLWTILDGRRLGMKALLVQHDIDERTATGRAATALAEELRTRLVDVVIATSAACGSPFKRT